MFNKLKSLIKQKVQRKSPRRTPRTTSFELVDYTHLLLAADVSKGDVEEIYTDRSRVGVQSVIKTLRLSETEKDKLASYASGCGDFKGFNEVVEIVCRTVVPVLEAFYKEHEGSTVIYPPVVDTIHHTNTVSRGWYLLKVNGTFTLICNYHTFKGE